VPRMKVSRCRFARKLVAIATSFEPSIIATYRSTKPENFVKIGPVLSEIIGHQRTV